MLPSLHSIDHGCIDARKRSPGSEWSSRPPLIIQLHFQLGKKNDNPAISYPPLGVPEVPAPTVQMAKCPTSHLPRLVRPHSSDLFVFCFSSTYASVAPCSPRIVRVTSSLHSFMRPVSPAVYSFPFIFHTMDRSHPKHGPSHLSSEPWTRSVPLSTANYSGQSRRPQRQRRLRRLHAVSIIVFLFFFF